METAELRFNHVFRNYGIPKDSVSNRGPQFISHLWKAFFKLRMWPSACHLGITHKAMVKLNARSRRLVTSFIPSVIAARTSLTASCPGPSTHRAHPITPHVINPLPVHAWIQTSSVPVVRQTIGSPFCWPLVQRELEGLGHLQRALQHQKRSVGDVSSTWWTGKDADLMKDLGYLGMTSWIRPYLPTSMKAILSVLLPEDRVKYYLLTVDYLPAIPAVFICSFTTVYPFAFNEHCFRFY